MFENQQGDSTREENTSLAIFREATQWLDAYFKGDNPEITIPLKPTGSHFQQCVWNELRQVPLWDSNNVWCYCQKSRQAA